VLLGSLLLFATTAIESVATTAGAINSIASPFLITCSMVLLLPSLTFCLLFLLLPLPLSLLLTVGVDMC
jgi:hypothetical protein